MNTTTLRPIIAALAMALAGLAVSQGAHAQAEVWRCGTDGRVYSDAPCPGGRTVPAEASRPASDIAEARARAEREKRLANTMVREREAREAAAIAASSLPAAIGPRHAPGAQEAARARKSTSRRSDLSQLSQAPAANPEKASRPRLARAQQPPRTADGETWRATAPSSRRGRG